jgi:hypothetical protein
MTPLDLANSLDTAGKTCKMVKLLQKAKVPHSAWRGGGARAHTRPRIHGGEVGAPALKHVDARETRADQSHQSRQSGLINLINLINLTEASHLINLILGSTKTAAQAAAQGSARHHPAPTPRAAGALGAEPTHPGHPSSPPRQSFGPPRRGTARPRARARAQEEFEKLDIERANLELRKRPKVRAVD